jgi:hypothetical protein
VVLNLGKYARNIKNNVMPMKMIVTTTLDRWFQKKREMWVDIVIAGRIFGGRHGESPQEPKTYELTSQGLLLRFSTTETLVVVGPESVMIGNCGELIVPSARKAVWGWHYYGREQAPENWCTESYLLDNGIVTLSVTGPIVGYVPARETFRYDQREFVKII